MYLETRYYNDGSAKARLYESDPEPDMNNGFDRNIADGFDRYVEEIGEDGDYRSLEDWLEQFAVETDDIVSLVLALDAGEWVDITPYI